MTLPVYVKDGTGSQNRLRVSDLNEVLNNQSLDPRTCTDTLSFPFSEFFVNGSSSDMRVDGSSTSVDFSVSARGDRDVFVKVISVFLSDAGAQLDDFGALSSLTNGVSFTYKTNSIGIVTIQDEIQTNYDFIRLGHSTHAVGDNTTAYKINFPGGASPTVYNPIIDLSKTFGFPWGLRLKKGSQDKLTFTVNDDLSAGMDGFNIKCFGAQL